MVQTVPAARRIAAPRPCSATLRILFQRGAGGLGGRLTATFVKGSPAPDWRLSSSRSAMPLSVAPHMPNPVWRLPSRPCEPTTTLIHNERVRGPLPLLSLLEESAPRTRRLSRGARSLRLFLLHAPCRRAKGVDRRRPRARGRNAALR